MQMNTDRTGAKEQKIFIVTQIASFAKKKKGGRNEKDENGCSGDIFHGSTDSKTSNHGNPEAECYPYRPWLFVPGTSG